MESLPSILRTLLTWSGLHCWRKSESTEIPLLGRESGAPVAAVGPGHRIRVSNEVCVLARRSQIAAKFSIEGAGMAAQLLGDPFD